MDRRKRCEFMECWVCNSKNLIKVKDANLSLSSISADNFRITDDNYGITGTLQQCRDCTFIQCSDHFNANEHYENMEDEGYEVSRSARKKEMLHILNYARRKTNALNDILDIGAGSGILVEVAGELGLSAMGVEPSKKLVQIAIQHKLDIKQGYFPNSEINKAFDLITLIDVIEHVNEPSKLIESLGDYLNEGGTILISTPDVSSILARIMKWNWWHYRIAHLGYFNQKTLDYLLERHGFINVGTSRPRWYFNADYLTNRILKLLTRKHFSLQLPKKIIIPVNLHDSILSAYRRRPNPVD